ncbi:hypothetical protein CWI84_01150 [Idiomarina tyrosinivorans]|uniref:Chalcone isomerase domain-containing protein n=1 Tax=Idiomarina tyrosinivorans TaxID=1445662 RepID=A0A432ZTX8_9GAMM|nr:chalcone isomerase family protein [Idiomarina tyrosinivorans]RUO81394.1 hypothetical protein CWI84_01150 [Idiomarina tyrosinivorans]
MKARIALLALALLASPAWALSQCKSEVPSDFKSVGKTRLSVLFWDVYDATLYSKSGDFNWPLGQQQVALQLDYLRDIDAADLVDKTAEEWQRMGFSDQRQSQWLQTLRDIWPDIKENDCLLLLQTETGASQFYQGTTLLGTIDSETFTEQFLAIWLSPQTDYPDERKELIGE